MREISDLDSSGAESPAAFSGKVPSQPPSRKGRRHSDVRSREYLTPREVDRLERAARRLGRHGHRDRTLILLMYRHALRVGEVVALRWDAVDFDTGRLAVARLKNGVPSTHPLRGPELRALRELKRAYPECPYLFVAEPTARGAPMTADGVRKIVARAGCEAGLPFPVHPHMLRHALGFKLANDGQDTRAIQHYMGHRSIAHTVRYTELSPDRFKTFFRD